MAEEHDLRSLFGARTRHHTRALAYRNSPVTIIRYSRDGSMGSSRRQKIYSVGYGSMSWIKIPLRNATIAVAHLCDGQRVHACRIPPDIGAEEQRRHAVRTVVNYQVQPQYYRTPPRCVAVLPSSLAHSDSLRARIIETAFARQLSFRVSRVIGPDETAQMARQMAVDLDSAGGRRRFGIWLGAIQRSIFRRKGSRRLLSWYGHGRAYRFPPVYFGYATTLNFGTARTRQIAQKARSRYRRSASPSVRSQLVNFTAIKMYSLRWRTMPHGGCLQVCRM